MQPRIAVIAGPTASGKTALSVALARAVGGEIVNADSMQIYRGMAIGTAAVKNYVKTGNPTLKVEVSNNARAVQTTWEDATTEVLQGKAYEFENEPESGFGIAVRVTVTKNANTERVYVTSLGFSFA